MLLSASSTEDVASETKKRFRQHKPRTSITGEESCDSGDYFVSLSKDLKTMKRWIICSIKPMLLTLFIGIKYGWKSSLGFVIKMAGFASFTVKIP